MTLLNKKFAPTLFAAFLVTFTMQAQNSWSLERCIQYAQQNSLTVKQAEYAIENAQLQEKSDRMSRLPSLNGSSSLGVQAGRTIDPTTNDFINQNVRFSSFNLNAGVVIFNGFRIKNSIAQSETDVLAARKDAEATNNNLALNIASAYLNILLAEEQTANATRQLAQAEEQLSQTDKLINAGVLPENDRLDILAQMALNEQTLVQAENSTETAYLLLKQLLELEPSQEISVEKPDVVVPADAQPEDLILNDVYTRALSTQPQIEAGDLRLKSAELGTEIAKAGRLPSLNAFAGMNSNWSSASRDFNNPIPDGEDIRVVSQDVTIDGSGPVTITQTIVTPKFTFPTQSFGDQLNQNFGQNIGLSLNVPIYNNSRNQINIERAQVGIKNQQVQNQQARQQLKSDIQNALANARAAKKSYAASQRANEAASTAYSNAERRFELGAINTFELSTAKNNLDRSEIDLTSAKYQYLFNLKVVDFYLGKQLSL